MVTGIGGYRYPERDVPLHASSSFPSRAQRSSAPLLLSFPAHTFPNRQNAPPLLRNYRRTAQPERAKPLSASTQKCCAVVACGFDSSGACLKMNLEPRKHSSSTNYTPKPRNAPKPQKALNSNPSNPAPCKRLPKKPHTSLLSQH